mgnify:CR=1 FL=1
MNAIKEVFIITTTVLTIVLICVAASIGIVYILDSSGYYEWQKSCKDCCCKGCEL